MEINEPLGQLHWRRLGALCALNMELDKLFTNLT